MHVRVMDTGLVEDAASDHAWMAGRRRATPRPPPGADGPIPQDGGHGTFTAGCVRVTAPEANVHVVNAARLLAPERPARTRSGAVFESDLADLLRRQLVADEGEPRSRCPTSWC